MNARSALFDLYGDHLRSRGRQAPVAALVRLLAALDIAAPAVRTAVSRMVRQGWLEPVRLPRGRGYALTPKAVRRLDEAGRRIYRGEPGWDGRWHVLVLGRVAERARRERLRAGLTFLGYAPLDTAAARVSGWSTTWLSPHASEELDALLDAEGIRAERFVAAYQGDARGLVARAWDLDGLARAYERWIAEAEKLVAAYPGTSDEQAFAVRSMLVHEWRKFLFRDPGLPAGLLPDDWPGARAARFFDAEAARLLPAASRFVDRCLQGEVREAEPGNHEGQPSEGA
jgi:phenylacetic acid degradation operon negative regulatory protein